MPAARRENLNGAHLRLLWIWRWVWAFAGVAFLLAAIRPALFRQHPILGAAGPAAATALPALIMAGYQAVQILATLALSIVLLWFPGLVAQHRVLSSEMRAAILVGIGPMLLAAIGAAAWALGPWIPPVVAGEIGAGLIWCCAGFFLWRSPPDFELSSCTQRAFAIAALCALAAIAKAAYSGGPEGELFRGEARRTLAVGNRSDAETSYRTVQVVARHLQPLSPEAVPFFAPWSFFSRGPLAGLVAAPVIFATGKPPLGPINAAWQSFDPWGYTTYRIVMALLAVTSLLAFFFVLTALVDEPIALIGVGAMALCPFILHEMMFTWPKLAATGGLLLSFLFAHRQRPALAGLALVLGYLFHPLALLWSPWIGLWLLGRGARTWLATISNAAWFVAPLLTVVVPWMAAGQLAQKTEKSFLAAQSAFLSYFVWAEGYPATWSTWLHSRWLNFANTFLPFWLHFFDESNADLNSVYGVAGPLVKFAFSWWNTLPLGMGLLLWSLCSIAIVQAWRMLSAGIAIFILGPAALLCIYWGDKSTGLMRECGHPLIPAVIAIAVVWFSRSKTRPGRIFFHRAFPWLQLPGALLMFWLTTLANPHPTVSYLRALDPVWFSVNIGALTAIAFVMTGGRSRLMQ